MSIVVSVHLFINTKAAAWGGASIFLRRRESAFTIRKNYMGTTRGDPRSSTFYHYRTVLLLFAKTIRTLSEADSNFLPLQKGAYTIYKRYGRCT